MKEEWLQLKWRADYRKIIFLTLLCSHVRAIRPNLNIKASFEPVHSNDLSDWCDMRIARLYTTQRVLWCPMWNGAFPLSGTIVTSIYLKTIMRYLSDMWVLMFYVFWLNDFICMLTYYMHIQICFCSVCMCVFACLSAYISGWGKRIQNWKTNIKTGGGGGGGICIREVTE